MNGNPYQPPDSLSDESEIAAEAKANSKLHVILGFVLFAIYVIVATPIAQISLSTGRFDNVVAMESAIWLIPFVVLIPWLSVKTITSRNPKKIRYCSAILIISFLGYTVILMMTFLSA